MENITISHITNFNISEIDKYPFLTALGYVEDELSENIRIPFSCDIFNLNETFIYYITSKSVIVYKFYDKSFLLVEITSEIKNVFLFCPIKLYLITEQNVIAIDLIPKNKFKYLITTKDFTTQTIFHYLNLDLTNTLELSQPKPLPSLEYPIYLLHPLQKCISLTQNNNKLVVEWIDSKNRYFYKNVMITLKSLDSLFSLSRSLISIFTPQMTDDNLST